jgi:hypothetical protein
MKTHPDGSLEDVTLCQEILNSLPSFKEIKSDLTIPKCTSNLFHKNEIAPEIDTVNSTFQFMEKTKVFGEKISLHNHSEPRESVLLNSFMKKPTSTPKIVKKLQEAPVTITEKVKLTQFKMKKDLIRRNTNNNVNLNIPMNLNLPSLSDFHIETTPLEDYFMEDNTNEIYAPQGTIYGDDINDYTTPLEIIKNYKTKNSGPIINNAQQGQYAQQSNNNYPTTPAYNPSVSNNTNNQNNVGAVNTMTMTMTMNTTQQIPQQQVSQPVPSIPVVNNIPKPNVPSIPSVPSNQNASKIPPVPKVPAVPKAPPIPPPKPKVETKTEDKPKPQPRPTAPVLTLQKFKN